MTQKDFLERYQYDTHRDRIGVGTFGKVFKAYDVVRDRDVALKIAEALTVGDKTLSLQDEIKAIEQLPDHQNIAFYEQVYRFKTPQGDFDYAIMQYYPEGSLAGYIKSNTLSISQKEQIAKGIINGVKFLHDNNVIHRDLKPGNILLVRRGEEFIPKITDFGLSKNKENKDHSFFENSIKGGTIPYSSPEQLLGNKRLYNNTDIWSIGIIIYTLFTGKLPFDSNSRAGTARDISIHQQILNNPIPSDVKNIQQPYQKIIKSCLVKDQNNRIKSVDSLVQILNFQDITEQPTLIENTISKPTKVVLPRKENSRKTWWKYGVLGIIGTVLCFGILTSRKDKNNTIPQKNTEADTSSILSSIEVPKKDTMSHSAVSNIEKNTLEKPKAEVKNINTEVEKTTANTTIMASTPDRPTPIDQSIAVITAPADDKKTVNTVIHNNSSHTPTIKQSASIVKENQPSSDPTLTIKEYTPPLSPSKQQIEEEKAIEAKRLKQSEELANLKKQQKIIALENEAQDLRSKSNYVAALKNMNEAQRLSFSNERNKTILNWIQEGNKKAQKVINVIQDIQKDFELEPCDNTLSRYKNKVREFTNEPDILKMIPCP